MPAPLQPNPFIRSLAAYVPGDQPSDPNVIKLNTNEFPYPAAPEVIEAIRREAADTIRLYPSSRCDALRRKLAELNGVEPDWILVGNGSDEILRLVTQAYAGPGRMTAMVQPTYSLYASLVQMTGTEIHPFALEAMERLPEEIWDYEIDLFLLSIPNPPLGTLFARAEIERLAGRCGLLLLDEAYIDFAGVAGGEDLVKGRANVMVTRTFSKSFGLAGMRVGYAIARPEVIAALDKIADSYNVNRASQAAALAALEARDYYAAKVRLVMQDRDWLRGELARRGFAVPASAANLLFAKHPRAEEIYRKLRDRKIYVRYFSSAPVAGGIRISIGTREQLEKMLAEIDSILAGNPA